MILLSVIPEKKSRYLMPVLIPLAINTGFYIEYVIRKFRDLKDKRETIPVYFNFGLMALIAIAFPIALYIFIGDNLSGHWLLFTMLSVITITLGILIVIYLKKKDITQVFMFTVVFFVAICMWTLRLLKPVIGNTNHSITTFEDKNIKIFGVNNVSPEIIWYYGKKIPQIKFEDGFYFLPDDQRFGILAYKIGDKDWNTLQKDYEIEKVDRFDMNTVAPDSKRHNDRLVNDFYILTRR